MRSLLHISRRLFCDLSTKNRQFLRRIRKNQQEIALHESVSAITEKKIADFVHNTPAEKIAFEMAKKTDYDSELKDFVEKFNVQHKNKITLLDFSSYVTDLGELKDKPLRKEDIELIKEFQKRKVDQRISQISKKIGQAQKTSLAYQSLTQMERRMITPDEQQAENQEKEEKKLDASIETQETYVDSRELPNDEFFQQGPFRVSDDFVIFFLTQRNNTKVTTLNRINSVKTLLFMGNGNGIISYAKGKGYTPGESLARSLFQLKKNIIAIPRDSRCTVPVAITKRFQDYWLYLRPKPGFNAHGHPLIALMLTLAGMDHCAFNVAHTQKNVYNVLKVLFKTVTDNTTPQQLAERQGFKVYRHQFIRPLTFVQTHSSTTNKQAKIRMYKNNKYNPVGIMDR